MKFNEIPYTRPSFEKVKEEMEELIAEFNLADSADSQLEIIAKINKIRNNLTTMNNLSHVRFTINMADEFYSAENDYWDEYNPQFDLLVTAYYQAVMQSVYLKEIKARTPETFVKKIEHALKSFDETVLEEAQLENKLVSQYNKLIASARIDFDGKVLTLAQLTPYLYSQDRKQRQKALRTKSKFFADNLEELDRVFTELVKVRTQMAHKLGYKDFTELGYLRMDRYDYDKEMVQIFRKQVLDCIVPLNNKLYARQTKRLKLDKLASYDEKYTFSSGNATPIGDASFIVEQGRKMYHELAAETGAFIDMMLDNGLVDLLSKPNKAAGGYCTDFADYKVPFIFSNFNGTKDDINVLTHEAGHAFQFYNSFHIEYPESIFPTYESCEIHSMSMEFFTWPYMDYFFGAAGDKYRYEHLEDSIKFIPYGVLVDHFQHLVYEDPEATAEERRKMWRDLEKQYLPHKDYSDNEFLEGGGWWYQQLHIYNYPFYYIDYTLAQVCALQFWKRLQDKDSQAWSDYVHLCRLGGTRTFTGLVDEANLISPFDSNCVPGIIGDVEKWLLAVDDTKF